MPCKGLFLNEAKDEVEQKLERGFGIELYGDFRESFMSHAL